MEIFETVASCVGPRKGEVPVSLWRCEDREQTNCGIAGHR